MSIVIFYVCTVDNCLKDSLDIIIILYTAKDD